MDDVCEYPCARVCEFDYKMREHVINIRFKDLNTYALRLLYAPLLFSLSQQRNVLCVCVCVYFSSKTHVCFLDRSCINIYSTCVFICFLFFHPAKGSHIQYDIYYVYSPLFSFLFLPLNFHSCLDSGIFRWLRATGIQPHVPGITLMQRNFELPNPRQHQQSVNSQVTAQVANSRSSITMTSITNYATTFIW